MAVLDAKGDAAGHVEHHDLELEWTLKPSEEDPTTSTTAPPPSVPATPPTTTTSTTAANVGPRNRAGPSRPGWGTVSGDPGG